MANFINQPLETSCIPGAGRSLTQIKRWSTEYRAEKSTSPDRYFSEKHQAQYRQVLSENGLHPLEIVGRFESMGQSTIITDDFQTGGSFASFIDSLHRWGNEEGCKKQLHQALSCIVVSEHDLPTHMKLPHAGLVSLQTIEISYGLRCALNGNLTHNKDRFIPHYPPLEWKNPPREVSAENIKWSDQIKAKIDLEVQTIRHGRLYKPLAQAPQPSRPETHPMMEMMAMVQRMLSP